jgi:hypothetical protein
MHETHWARQMQHSGWNWNYNLNSLNLYLYNTFYLPWHSHWPFLCFQTSHSALPLWQWLKKECFTNKKQKYVYKKINSVLLPFLHLGVTGNAGGWSCFLWRLRLTLLEDLSTPVTAAILQFWWKCITPEFGKQHHHDLCRLQPHIEKRACLSYGPLCTLSIICCKINCLLAPSPCGHFMLQYGIFWYWKVPTPPSQCSQTHWTWFPWERTVKLNTARKSGGFCVFFLPGVKIVVLEQIS